MIKIKAKEVKPKEKKLYEKLETIIIDEISMVRADLLDCIDTFLRMYGPKKRKPFGGVQMIFVGDLYQIPPVVTKDEKHIFEDYYKTPYFFSSKALAKHEVKIIELEKIYRQKDAKFIELLNKVRNNSVESTDLQYLNSRLDESFESDDSKFYITLTSTNKKADEANQKCLKALPAKLHVTEAHITGKLGKEYYPTLEELHYKIGSQIMLLNNDSKRRWVNGSIAVIERIDSEEIDGEEREFVAIKILNGKSSKTIKLYPHTWEIFKFTLQDNQIVSEPVGTFTQYPFRLAWAVTIHKSQGKTFDNVIIDIGRGTFVTGQMYVALSRATSFEGVVLKKEIKAHHIRTDYKIFNYLTKHQYQKSEQALPKEEKISLIQECIKKGDRLSVIYLKANDTKSERILEPIKVGIEHFKGKKFDGLEAFCEKRQEIRMFRIDRILAMNVVK